jgi:hypothetical protein
MSLPDFPPDSKPAEGPDPTDPDALGPDIPPEADEPGPPAAVPVVLLPELAHLPEPRQRAAALVHDYMLQGRTMTVVVRVGGPVYVVMATFGLGSLAVDRAILDLLAAGLAETDAPSLDPWITVRARPGPGADDNLTLDVHAADGAREQEGGAA